LTTPQANSAATTLLTPISPIRYCLKRSRTAAGLAALLRGEAPALAWLETFPRLPLDDANALESVQLRQRHGLKILDAIIRATRPLRRSPPRHSQQA
jgi:predicted nucleic acid-binding protein